MLAATQTTIRYVAVEAGVPAPVAQTLISAAQWLLACFICALVYWGIMLMLARRGTPRAQEQANPAILLIALVLVALAGSTVAIQGKTFAQQAPLVAAPIQILILLYFYLFSDSRFALGRTRWLAILYMMSEVGTYIPPRPSNNHIDELIRVPGLIGALTVIGEAGSIALLAVAVQRQVYYRYRHLGETGERQRVVPRAAVAGVCAALASSFAMLIASLALATPDSQPSSPALVLVRAVFTLGAEALPIAAAFALLQSRFYDRPALRERVLVYGTLTIAMITLYAICMLGLGIIIPGFGGFSPLGYLPFIVLVTIALSVLYRPLQTFVTESIDRRFFRERYALARAGTALRESGLRDLPLAQSSEQIVRTIQQTVHPLTTTLWLRTTTKATTAHSAGTEDQPASSAASRQTTAMAGVQLRPQAASTPAEQSAPTLTITLHDPARPELLRPASALETARLPETSDAVRALVAGGTKLIVSFVCQGELIGLLALGPPAQGDAYTFDERELLATIADELAPALDAVQRTHEQVLEDRQRERVEHELQTARRIQISLLPRTVPALDGWQIATSYQPAREVGGDFYDFLPLADGRLGLVLGDVADKGIPAALVMATTRSTLRAVAAEPLISPGAVLARVNELLCQDLPTSMFVTCFYAILEPESGRLAFANAGQTLPYLRGQDGTLRELRACGMPLGLMPEMHYDEEEADMYAGDCLLFLSDGLVEAHNPQREMFGSHRLAETLCEREALGAPPIIDVLKALQAFTGRDWEQEDDITLVSLQRTPAEASSDDTKGETR
jgi:serine phosphatase RsbU (regulator of sigma subunit)